MYFETSASMPDSVIFIIVMMILRMVANVDATQFKYMRV